jgi:hypothetical protein
MEWGNGDLGDGDWGDDGRVSRGLKWLWVAFIVLCILLFILSYLHDKAILQTAFAESVIRIQGCLLVPAFLGLLFATWLWQRRHRR